MPSTKKMTAIMNKLDKSAETRHAATSEQIKALDGKITDVKTDIMFVRKQQGKDGRSIATAQSAADTAIKTADIADKKANDLGQDLARMNGAAGAGQAPVQPAPAPAEPPTKQQIVVDYAKRNAPGAAIGIGGLVGSGGVGYVLWILADIVKTYLATH